MNGEILIAGIGNIFLGDDAFGVEVVKRLSKSSLPPFVKVKDFGIRSYDLAYALMDEWEFVILVDAVPTGEEPGTLVKLQIDISQFGDVQPSLDAHTMNPVSVLQLVNMLGGKPNPVLVIGCQPSNIDSKEDGNMELSAPVKAAVDEAICMINEEIAGSCKVRAA